jgi:hypothetical protein
MSDGGMYARLADLRVPRPWWWWATPALALIRDGRRNGRQTERLGRDLGESVVMRWEETDSATESMFKMTQTMVWVTWAVVVLTVVVIAATLYLGIRQADRRARTELSGPACNIFAWPTRSPYPRLVPSAPLGCWPTG